MSVAMLRHDKAQKENACDIPSRSFTEPRRLPCSKPHAAPPRGASTDQTARIAAPLNRRGQRARQHGACPCCPCASRRGYAPPRTPPFGPVSGWPTIQEQPKQSRDASLTTLFRRTLKFPAGEPNFQFLSLLDWEEYLELVGTTLGMQRTRREAKIDALLQGLSMYTHRHGGNATAWPIRGWLQS